MIVANGEKDPYIVSSMLERIKTEYKNIETVLVEDAYHFLQQESPEKVNKIIRDFLVKNKLWNQQKIVELLKICVFFAKVSFAINAEILMFYVSKYFDLLYFFVSLIYMFYYYTITRMTKLFPGQLKKPFLKKE